MTTLLTNQCYNDIEQSQKIRLYNSIHLKGLRLHIYKAGILTDGQLTCGIYKNDSLVTESSISFTDLNSISNEYWQGLVLFEFDPILFISIDGEYEEIEFRFKIENHTDSDINHIDIVRNYEAFKDVSEYKRPPLYGGETNDSLTTEYSNSMPISIELYVVG